MPLFGEYHVGGFHRAGLPPARPLVETHALATHELVDKFIDLVDVDKHGVTAIHWLNKAKAAIDIPRLDDTNFHCVSSLSNYLEKRHNPRSRCMSHGLLQYHTTQHRFLA